MTKRPKQTSKSKVGREDDQALWNRVAETITPINKKGRIHQSVEEQRDAGAVANRPKNAPEKPVSTRAKTAVATPRPQKSPEAASPLRAPGPKGLGQTALRRVRSGRTAIEARLDLHGMRQSEAHSALVRFLHASQQKGRRWVLVITGKGTRRALSQDDDGFDNDEWRTEPGVLRRSVPRWLQEPDLRPLVIGYQNAAPQHGGEGALYIHLRRYERTNK